MKKNAASPPTPSICGWRRKRYRRRRAYPNTAGICLRLADFFHLLRSSSRRPTSLISADALRKLLKRNIPTALTVRTGLVELTLMAALNSTVRLVQRQC